MLRPGNGTSGVFRMDALLKDVTLVQGSVFVTARALVSSLRKFQMFIMDIMLYWTRGCDMNVTMSENKITGAQRFLFSRNIG